MFEWCQLCGCDANDVDVMPTKIKIKEPIKVAKIYLELESTTNYTRSKKETASWVPAQIAVVVPDFRKHSNGQLLLWFL